MSITPLKITAYTLVSGLGRGLNETFAALSEGRSGLRNCELPEVEFPTFVGRVDGLEQQALPPRLEPYNCRNNRLALLGLEQDGLGQAVEAARRRHGARRVGVFLGTSTAGIGEAERAYSRRDPVTDDLPHDFHYRQTHNLFSPTEFVREHLGLEGPAATVSTACSSSAKVFAVAHRYLQTGWCDAALVGGVDSLCLTTIYGFHSLGLISDEPCRPWDRQRKGINIGEAAGFVLLERTENAAPGTPLLLGYGESSDAYHIASPHPQGAGAALAMERALASAGLRPADLDYVNLHGTGTRLNDQSEDRAMAAVFGQPVPCSCTKGYTGHNLGAAGITEAVIVLLSLVHGLLPGTRNFQEADPELAVPVLTETRRQPLARAMSNSFGFGGSNCSLIFGRVA